MGFSPIRANVPLHFQNESGFARSRLMREHTRLLAIPLRRPSRLDVVLRFGPLDRRQFFHQRTREHLVAIGHRNDLELARSEEHTSELQSLMRIPSAVFCLKKKTSTS